MDTPSPIAIENSECPNCGSALEGKFCSSCGQKRIDKHEYGVRRFFGNIVHEITHLDSNKITKTAKTLLFKPGELTKEYFGGRRGHYINPIRIYLTVSAIYLLFAWGALVTAGGGDASINASRPWLVAQAQERVSIQQSLRPVLKKKPGNTPAS